MLMGYKFLYQVDPFPTLFLFYLSWVCFFFLDLFGVYKVGGNPGKTEEYEIIVVGGSVSFTSLIFLMSFLGHSCMYGCVINCMSRLTDTVKSS